MRAEALVDSYCSEAGRARRLGSHLPRRHSLTEAGRGPLSRAEPALVGPGQAGGAGGLLPFRIATHTHDSRISACESAEWRRLTSFAGGPGRA